MVIMASRHTHMDYSLELFLAFTSRLNVRPVNTIILGTRRVGFTFDDAGSCKNLFKLGILFVNGMVIFFLQLYYFIISKYVVNKNAIILFSFCAPCYILVYM